MKNPINIAIYQSPMTRDTKIRVYFWRWLIAKFTIEFGDTFQKIIRK